MTEYRLSECYDTIQGEGFHAGTPMTLLRLQGCSVGCPWCDTKYSWPHVGKSKLGTKTAAEIVGLVRDACHRRYPEWVMVTGGEPAEQDLTELAEALTGAGLKLALDTSGTASGHLESRRAWTWVCVSPKENMPGGKVILPEVIESADELRFVIGKPAHVEAMEAFIARHRVPWRTLISVQPLSQNKKATELCVETAMLHGWRLSLQQNKLMGLR